MLIDLVHRHTEELTLFSGQQECSKARFVFLEKAYCSFYKKQDDL